MLPFEEPTPEDYLDYVDGWKDPYPAPIVERHPPFLVVRDDLLGFGSKTRFIDYLVGHEPATQDVKEWVFGSAPANGWGPVSLSHVCAEYGKKAVFFMAKRNHPSPEQQAALNLGATIHWVENGMLTVTQKRARDYVLEKPKTRKLLPIGLEHPTVLGSIIKVARNLEYCGEIVVPKYVWSVGSSGTLNRGLQLAWPDAEVHVVSVGHTMSEKEIGRAIFHKSKYKLGQQIPERERPPYDSPWSYDSKFWQPMSDWYWENYMTGHNFEKSTGKGPILCWNVAGNLFDNPKQV